MTEQPKDYLDPEYNPGDCSTCGEWSGELIDGMCPPCRERYAPDEIARRVRL